MSKALQLHQAILDYLDPKFKIAPKEKSLLGRIHSRIFGDHAAVILGHTCYAPTRILEEELPLAQLLAHEGCHLAQRRDLGLVRYAFRYGFPQIVGVGILAICLTIFIAICAVTGISIYTLPPLGVSLFSLPFFVKENLAEQRTLMELEAYATSWWVLGIQSSTGAKQYWPIWVSGIQKLLNSSTYLHCGKNMPYNSFETLLRVYLSPMDNEKTFLKRWHSLVKNIFLA